MLPRVLAGDDAGIAVCTLPQLPKGKSIILKYVQLWIERTRGVAVLLQRDNVAGTTKTSEKRPNWRGRSMTGWLRTVLVTYMSPIAMIPWVRAALL